MNAVLDNRLLEKLVDNYKTNTIIFTTGVLEANEHNDNLFFNDEEHYRYYGRYLIVKDVTANNEYAIPYYYGLSFPILTSLIDMMLNGGYDLSDNEETKQ